METLHMGDLPSVDEEREQERLREMGRAVGRDIQARIARNRGQVPVDAAPSGPGATVAESEQGDAPDTALVVAYMRAKMPFSDTVGINGRGKKYRQVESRFQGTGTEDLGTPTSALEFLLHGGMRKQERVAVARAAGETLRFEREWWLPILEQWLAEETASPSLIGLAHTVTVADLKQEIKRLRRQLGVATPPAEVRAHNRDRVRRHRAKGRAT
jgi:hypothetical protein